MSGRGPAEGAGGRGVIVVWQDKMMLDRALEGKGVILCILTVAKWRPSSVVLGAARPNFEVVGATYGKDLGS